MARMGLAGAAGRWWGLALGLTAFFLPGSPRTPDAGRDHDVHSLLDRSILHNESTSLA